MTTDVGGGNFTQCSIGGTDIRNLVVMLEYFENIFSPTASLSLSVSDAAGFYENLKKDGGEDVEFSFGGRAGQAIRMKMKTAKISDRTRSKENQDLYKINCVPSEFLENNKKEIVKAYKEKKVSDMVGDWHKDYTEGSTTLKKDLVTNEGTEGNASYVGSGRSPITAIRWGAKEGKSSDAKASNYVYYQDRDGYHFKTIAKMLEGSSIATLSYSSQNIGAAGGNPNDKIIAFDQQSDTNALDSSYNGASSDHYYYYDPTTGKIAGGSKREQEGDSARGQRFNFVAAPGVTKSKFRDSRDPKIAENKRSLPEHGAESSAANLLDNMVINVRVPGDIKYKPGVKVKLNLPANQEANQLDKRSGDFLVTAVRHVIYKDDKDTKYEVFLQCKKEGAKQQAAPGAGGIT
jgi:hypothetical protein